MILLGFVILYVICFIIGLIGCLYDGRLVWQDGWFRAVDSNGKIIEPKPYVKPTDEEIKQMRAENQEKRRDKASWYCIFFLGAFILGIITGKPQFHAAGLTFLFGTLLLDYKTFYLGLLLWYIVIPAIVVMAIVSLFKKN